MKGVVWELIFVILGAFWHPFSVPGASNLSGFFVQFLGRAPGSLLGVFWVPFGCPLGALWVPWGRLWETLGQLWQLWGLLCKGCPTLSHHVLPYPTIFPPSD